MIASFPAGPIIVVKLGGSLLDWPAWPTRLKDFLATRPDARQVLIVGGGRFADHLRDLDQLHGLGESRSHDLALRILDTTAHLAAALLPGSVVVAETTELPPVWIEGKLPIFAPRHFLALDDLVPDPLPHAWTTTTDSIAARVAVRIGASELVLLKSTCLTPDIPTWEAAALRGLVDPEFPRVVDESVYIQFVNLREGDRANLKSSSFLEPTPG